MASPRDVAAVLGRVGIFTFFVDRATARDSARFVHEVEALGYRALWIGEGAQSKEILSHATLLLSAASRLIVATGIANIWARDPVAMRNAERVLMEAFPGRFVLGLGVSHAPAVKRRGGTYERPLAYMRGYLDAMEQARYVGPEPSAAPLRVLAALGPQMLDLAAKRTAGAHPYFVPVKHTAYARKRIGQEPLLAVEQAVVHQTDAGKAREIARAHMKGYLFLANYTNNLRRLGFSEEDIAGPSDRLVDAIVAHGDLDAIVARIRAHHDAGADHVCVQVLDDDPVPTLRELAKRL